MRASTLLQTILNLAYYFFLIIGAALFIFILYILFGGPIKYPLSMFSEYITIDSKKILLFLLIPSLMFHAAYTYLVYLIKKLVDDLADGQLFNRFQVAGFKHIGQMLIFLSITESIFDFIFKLIFKSRMKVQIDSSNFWISILLGLFFIFLSTIFKRAQDLKEENDLTV